MSWWQLYSILAEKAAYEEFYFTQEPVACPRCGEPLRPGPPQETLTLYCRFDGWEYPRDWDPYTQAGM